MQQGMIDVEGPHVNDNICRPNHIKARLEIGGEYRVIQQARKLS